MAPASIAVVGATDRPGSYAAETLLNLEAIGFPGPVWGVNPRRTEVLGRAVRAQRRRLARGGRRRRGGDSGGGRQRGGGAGGRAGLRRRRRVQRGLRRGRRRDRAAGGAGGGRAASPGCRCAGPTATGSSRRGGGWRCGATRSDRSSPGAVALVSQSGNVAVNALATRRGLRFHTVIASGNQAVLSAADYLHFLAADEGVRSVALYLEDDGGPGLCDGAGGVRGRRRGRGRAEGRQLGDRGAGGRRPQRRAGRRPAGVSQPRGGGRGGVGRRRARAARARQDAGRSGDRGRRAIELAPRRAGDHDLLGRRLGAGRRRGRTSSGWSCPSSRRRRASGWPSCCRAPPPPPTRSITPRWCGATSRRSSELVRALGEDPAVGLGARLL